MHYLANGNAPSMAVNPQQQNPVVASNQPDYSKQWAEYYRSIGKNDDAEAIENQIKTKVFNNCNICTLQCSHFIQ